MQPKSRQIPAENGIPEAGDFPVPQDQDTTNLLSASSKRSYTPLVYDPKEYAPLKKVWGDQLINELIAAGKPWNNPQVMKRELGQNFFGTFHDIEEAMANLFEDQKDTPFVRKFRKPGTKDIDWTALASKVVSPNHALPQLFIVAIPGAAGDVHVFVRDARKKKAAYDVPEPQAVDPDNPTPEEEAEWQEWAADRNESLPEPGVVFAAADELNDPTKVNLTGEEPATDAPEEKAPIDFIDDIVKLVSKKLPAYRTKFRKPLGYKEVEKDLVDSLGISPGLASLVTPAINLRTDTTLIAPAFKADLLKILKSPKAKSAVDHVIEQFTLPTSDAKADKEWDSPYCNNHGNERPTRDSASIESSMKEATMLSQPVLEALRAKTLKLTSEFEALKGSTNREAEKALDDITAALAVVGHHIDDLTEGLLEKKGAIEQHKEPKKLPPRKDMQTHLDKDIRDEIAAEKKENKEGTQKSKSQLLTSHVGTGVSPTSLLRRRR